MCCSPHELLKTPLTHSNTLRQGAEGKKAVGMAGHISNHHERLRWGDMVKSQRGAGRSGGERSERGEGRSLGFCHLEATHYYASCQTKIGLSRPVRAWSNLWEKLNQIPWAQQIWVRAIHLSLEEQGKKRTKVKEQLKINVFLKP